jgi:uncharacterized protein YbcI
MGTGTTMGTGTGTGMGMGDEQRTDAPTLIASELVRIHEESYGVGMSGGVDVYLLDDHYVLCVLENDLAPAERTLIDNDKGEIVRSTREAFQEAVETTFTSAIERATGRSVDAFVSHFHVEPHFTLEFFRLAPPAGPGPAEPE